MRRLVLAIAILLTATPNLRADLLLDLNYSDGSVAKTVFSGDTVVLDLILRDPSDDTFISTEGLGSGGGVLIDLGGGVISLAPTGPPVEGPGFDPMFTGPGAPAPRPGIIDSVSVTSPFVPVGLGMTDVLLATFSYVATGPLGSSTTISADVLDPGGIVIGNETFFPAFTDLDAVLTDLGTTPTNFGSVDLAISTTPIPEPSTLFVGSLIVGAGVVWRRRRRNMAAV